MKKPSPSIWQYVVSKTVKISSNFVAFLEKTRTLKSTEYWWQNIKKCTYIRIFVICIYKNPKPKFFWIEIWTTQFLQRNSKKFLSLFVQEVFDLHMEIFYSVQFDTVSVFSNSELLYFEIYIGNWNITKEICRYVIK